MSCMRKSPFADNVRLDIMLSCDHLGNACVTTSARAERRPTSRRARRPEGRRVSEESEERKVTLLGGVSMLLMMMGMMGMMIC